MSTTLTLVDLAGAIALLLWGLHMVQTGVQRAFGSGLRRLLAVALGSRLKAFGCGMAVTAVLQSSTATGLMVSSFAAAGLVDLVPAMAAMLGANVGTTLIVQLLAFDVSRVAALAVLVGVMMFRRGQQTRTRDLGRVAIGLGLMLMALHALLGLVTPYEDVPSLRLLLGSMATEPVVAVLVAAAFTWAAHSSVATVLLVMSFAEKGVIPPHAALAMVLGANLGTAINPVLEGASGENGVGRHLPIGNLLNRVLGCGLALLLLDRLGPALATLIDDPAREVAIFHTGFNLVMALLFLPVLGPFARFLRVWLPSAAPAADPAQPIYLGAAEQEAPTVALAGAAREALRMSDLFGVMLQEASSALHADDRKRIGDLKARHDSLERLDDTIRTYVMDLEPDAMSDADRARLGQVLAFTSNLDHASDLLARALGALAARRTKQGLTIPPDDGAVLATAFERLAGTLRAAAAVFMTQDGQAARALVAGKEAFRHLEATAAEAHLATLRTTRGPVVPLHLDLLRDLKRINAHLVAASAYPVLEAEGALLPTRLREEGEIDS